MSDTTPTPPRADELVSDEWFRANVGSGSFFVELPDKLTLYCTRSHEAWLQHDAEILATLRTRSQVLRLVSALRGESLPSPVSPELRAAEGGPPGLSRPR